MYLKRLCLINFKNIRDADLAFSGNLNCFVGDNGTGKTNVLDSVYYLSMCKSAFNLTDGQSVNHDADFFMIDGHYTISGERNEHISCGFKRGSGKTIKRNQKDYEKLSEHIGRLPVVLVAPSDTSLINESGEDRRRFVNTMISQLDGEYLNALIKYNHILAERNKLLKQQRSSNFSEIIDVLDMQLASYGETIHKKRTALIEQLSPVVEYYYAKLSGDREDVSIGYKSELNGSPFEEILKESREKDMFLQYSTAGIHRDDIVMKISGYPLRKFGSQGQQKSFLIALKLAQFEIITQRTNLLPILLLDDIFDKLDMTRVERLITLVSDSKFGQIFISDSNKVRLETILAGINKDYKLFEVESGVVKETGQ